LEYTTVAIELLANVNSGYLLLSTMKGCLMFLGAPSFAAIDSEVIAKG
jgi:hypothetical protein